MFTNELADKDWVFSDEYKRVLERKNFEANCDFIRIGAWRWEGIFQNRRLVASFVFDQDKVGIDFGGYQGPIGGYAKIIDIKLNNSLDDIEDGSLDYIFTSHTLEHIDNLENVLRKMVVKLKKYGQIIVLVPSYKKERWRAGINHAHRHTFKLAKDPNYEAVNLDKLLEDVGFYLLISEYCYKCQIFIHGIKNG